MNDRKTTIMLTIIAVATLIVALVGATFAYFSSTGDTSKEIDVTVKTGSAGSSSFIVENGINIYADAINFAQGKSNRTGTSTGKVSFTAPTLAEGETDTSTTFDFCYTITLNISKNEFGYTTSENTSELTLDVNSGETAFISNKDITTYKGEIKVPTSIDGTDYIHKLSTTASNTVEKEWNATVTLVNLDTPQNDNTGKNLNGTITFASASCE